jgi:predicted amidohydrolase YtcJ
MRIMPYVGLALVLVLGACGPMDKSASTGGSSGAIVLINGDFVTMDLNRPSAEAMAYEGGRIVAIGTEQDVRGAVGGEVSVVDLSGRTVVPGFFETHDHLFLSSATATLTDISPFTTPTLAAALDRLRAAEPSEDGWIMAFGADQTLYEEKKGPTRDLLDEIFPDVPVIVFHLSGHGGFVNSEAFQIAGVDEDTPDPPGGFLERDDEGRLTGYLAGQPALFLVRSYPAPSVKTARVAAQQRAARGVTTASDFSIMNGSILDVLVETTRADDLAVRLVGGIFVTAPDFENLIERIEESENELFRIPFVKTWTDGSLQGGTGYLIDGYYDTEMGSGGAQGSQDKFNEQVARIYELGMWPAVHANGDGAADIALNAIEHAQRVAGEGADSGIRPQIIHAQVTNEDQIKRMAELGASPTFFTTHVYYWGDLHAARTVGPKKVHRLSAMADGFKHGTHPSMHNDPPVTPVDPIFNMWIAVNRTSRSGKLYGRDQAITPEQALAAYTINGAYQFGMEDETGSLEAGKQADFVVLDRNPLKVSPEEIRDISIEATVLGGRQTYVGDLALDK